MINIILKLFSFIFFITFFLNTYSHSDEIDKYKLIKMYKNVRCLVCQSQSIYESNSDFSQSAKKMILEKVKAGQSEAEIYDFLESKYGEWIILKPSFNFKNLILWTFPYIIFFIGGFFLFLYIRKRRFN